MDTMVEARDNDPRSADDRQIRDRPLTAVFSYHRNALPLQTVMDQRRTESVDFFYHLSVGDRCKSLITFILLIKSRVVPI